jgi:hypothetical protein
MQLSRRLWQNLKIKPYILNKFIYVSNCYYVLLLLLNICFEKMTKFKEIFRMKLAREFCSYNSVQPP